MSSGDVEGFWSFSAGFPYRCRHTPARGRGQGLTGGQPAQRACLDVGSEWRRIPAAEDQLCDCGSRLSPKSDVDHGAARNRSGCRSSLRHARRWHGVIRPQPGGVNQRRPAAPPAGGGQTCAGLASWLRPDGAHAGRARPIRSVISTLTPHLAKTPCTPAFNPERRATSLAR